MPKKLIPTCFIVLAAVRRDDRFLLVHERKHGQLWYLPAGRAEIGEDLIEAAERETLEEAGIPIEVDGIVRMEHSPSFRSSRVRLIFSARPKDDTPPKSIPDEESLEADWFSMEEVTRLPLRGPDVLDIFSYLEAGGTVAPLSLLAREGDAFPDP